MNGDIAYCHYLVAFIDILGQKDVFKDVQGLPRNDVEKEILYRALRRSAGFITKFREGFKNYFDSYSKPTGLVHLLPENKKDVFAEMSGSRIKIQGFSDFVAAFAPLSTNSHHCVAMNSVFGALTACGLMSLLSLFAKHAVRGGIEIDGAFEIFEGEVYGPALNKAYKLESEVAKYPRIVIGKGVLDYLAFQMAVPEHNDFATYCRALSQICYGLITQDSDGVPILDYLGRGCLTLYQDMGTIRVKGKDYNIAVIVNRARDFVREEHKKFREKGEGDSKLASRYQLLSDYFDSRLSQ